MDSLTNEEKFLPDGDVNNFTYAYCKSSSKLVNTSETTLTPIECNLNSNEPEYCVKSLSQVEDSEFSKAIDDIITLLVDGTIDSYKFQSDLSSHQRHIIYQFFLHKVKIYNSSATQLIDHLKIHNIKQNNQPNIEKNHLKKRRPDFSSESENDENNFDIAQNQTKITIKQKAKINKYLMNFILNNNLPFKIVESPDFQKFIDIIKPNYFMFGSVTSDVWTSNSNMAYICFTFHYVNDYLELKNRVLCLKYLNDSHSSDYLHDSLVSIMREWNVLDKTFAINTDSGANMKGAVAKFSNDMLKLPCAAHKLNSCVADLLNIKKIKIKIDKNNNQKFFWSNKYSKHILDDEIKNFPAFKNDLDGDDDIQDFVLDGIDTNIMDNIKYGR
ncbi:unnamed protein product [Brachionus calyciflorus]|uniref:Uncharacterized protein n=1 Tax=Brachionus calyciflorus TaxID=104777 RepID=A0A813M179_9BILA|nr:unnamed protein product [Brachionus calyciflorus]